MQVAIYARVSTERQGREQASEGQLAALRAWVDGHGHALDPAHVYTDEGYSGSRLDRPGLDRLRDDAQAGQFGAVAVFSPDRLARKYAYQVIVAALSEALARAEGARQVESPLLEQVQHVRRALGDLAVEVDVSHLPPQLRPRDDLPDTDTLRESMPKLVPPLSATLSADREDRF